ncbi:insulin receptor substrate 2-A isoform X3 [Nilaparvata lugens]|uniref:insulin receptor substrate 2-A isoform X3 n=1 Tax=Nilaparvata lugens TaxID=108931 RepID=UPI00193CCDC3|nr:insulin receptor substrate 2-A isoform X3 [Nilaparvata lugens]
MYSSLFWNQIPPTAKTVHIESYHPTVKFTLNYLIVAEMSVKSWSSLGGGGDKEPPHRQSTDDIVKMGYLKKLKTMRKKYFVLRKDSAEASARLEYYDSEKKFRANNRPKRSITLKTCFNINKRNDTRQKWVIALYTKNDCFCLVLENDLELDDWLKKLLTLQTGEDIPDGEPPPRPAFEHVWQVVVQKKELGHSKNILGPYHLCLTDKTLSLVKMGPNAETSDPIEFSLHSIRRCGELESFFYLELGQMAVTGAGNLWMQTEDNNIAQNMHAAILSACKRNSQKDLAPKARHRSSSATEASKPITVNQRWAAAHSVAPAGAMTGGGGGGAVPMHQRTYSFPLSPLPPSRRASTGNRPANNKHYSSSSSSTTSTCHNSMVGVGGGRERCASMPSSRQRTSSEGGHRCPSFARPSSIYNSYSPQMTDLSPVSPEREGLTDSSLSMDGDGMEFSEGCWQGRDCENRLGHSLTPEEPVIMEEGSEDCLRWTSGEEERINNSTRERSLCLPIQNNNLHYRKISPNSTAGFKPSSPSQASLSDMYSPPCGSSPLETSSAYMPMSPGERGMIGVRTGGAHSANHSRGSSLAEEGYVPMAPSIHDDGYVDMDIHGRSNRNLSEQFGDGELSASSSCSMTSGTPSTDIRFPEYTLEKVSTYITPSEDDLTPSERPARAYSVGSRPMLNKRTEILNQSECQQRTRAFSVGSRCPRLPPESTLPANKRALSSSHSSVEPSEDLMEIDFSKNNKRRNRYFKKPSSAERLAVPPNGSLTSSLASSYSTAEGSSYMDMSPRGSPKLYEKEQAHSEYVHASSPKTHELKFGRSPPNSFATSSSPPVIGFSSVLGQVPEGETGFIEPRPPPEPRPFHHGRSPPAASASPLRRATDEGAYMPMQPGEATKSVVAKTSRPRVDSFPVAETSKPSNQAPKTSSLPTRLPISSVVNANASHSLKSIRDESSEPNALKRKSSSVEDNNNTKMMMTRTAPMEVPSSQCSNDDYVQMAPDGRPVSIRRVSLDNSSSRNEDYMNMTPGNGNGNGKQQQQQQQRNGRKERTRFNSQPIAIRSSTSGAAQAPCCTYNGVRKLSSGTPPKVPSYLGLSGSSPSSSPYSSLGRRRSKAEAGLARSESRDSNGGLSTPDTPIFRISLNSPISPTTPTSYDSAAKCPVDATDGTIRISYLPSQQPSDQSDYINYNPRQVSGSCDDYLPMQPGKPPEPVRKISAPPVFATCSSAAVAAASAAAAASASAVAVVDEVVADLGGLEINSSQPSSVCSGAAAAASSQCSTIEESPAEPAAATERHNCHAPSTSQSAPASQPPIAEKELHYASLDLVKPEESRVGGGTDLRNQSSTSSASTPSPNIQHNTSTATFTYAQIDFSKNIH